MTSGSDIREAFGAAIPIMLGYAAIGIPCGILSASIGMNVWQVLIMCVLFYSGAGQFMIPNMWLAGSPIASIVLSVSLVNTRQMLYSASFAPRCRNVGRPLAFLFAATVTDESFGVNSARFEAGEWTVKKATLVNLCSQSSWTAFNVVGVLVGSAIPIPLAVASFAMTSIFICLVVVQKITPETICAIITAFVGVYVVKLLGLGGFAIVAGALLGVASALVLSRVRKAKPARRNGPDVQAGSADTPAGAVEEHRP